MEDDSEIRTVRLRYPRNPDDRHSPVAMRHQDSETWITMIEQMLSSDFVDYTVTVTQDHRTFTTEVVIVFASLEDAVWFKMRRN
jgi:hypothetical protein